MIPVGRTVPDEGPQMSPAPDSTLADARRSNARLQRKLAELRRRLDEALHERDEALQRETAAAEVLQAINSSPGDLAPVFDAMLERAMALCSAEYGHIYTFDGQQFHAVAIKGQTEFVSWRRQRGAIRPEGDGSSPLERLIAGERALQVAAVWDEKAYRTHPRFGELVDTSGIRSIAAAALHKEGSLLGAIIVYRREVRPFTDKQIALLQNFAVQAVIAVENARLITETREALEEQTATADVLQVINSSPGDLAPVFDAILEKAHSLCGVTFGFLQLYDSGKLRAVALRGVPEAVVEPARQGFSPSPNHPIRGLLDGVPYVHIGDLAEIDDPAARRVAQLGGIRTSLFVALRKDGTLLGMISAGRKEIRPFTDKQIALLQNFAAQAVIAMDNARLLGELRQRNDEIAGWNRELEARVAAQLAELERTGKLRRFLAPQLADLIIAQGDESILESHRREIVVVFCDIRGFTAFAERAEPEEVMALLRDYHAALGPIVARFEGTLDHYNGDGVMVFFNDPLPTPEPAKRAIEMAAAMRDAAQKVLKAWRRHGHELGFGVGISQGYATLGQIGFAERMDYTAIGTVTNLAAHLCSEAKDGQILISRRVAVAVEEDAKLEEIGEISLKGLSQAVAVYNVLQ